MTGTQRLSFGSTTMLFSPTREAALQRLHDFVPRAGRAYANSRNYDDGPPDSEARQNVSQLSPWLHAGIISETEVLDAVLAQHGPHAAEKFVAEVFWRIYFKGYLEQRPSIWPAYCEQRDKALGQLDANSGLKTAYDQAVGGSTGIEAFDHWARELVQTGYLHNHARMWFASIWIFTLKLDWTLGADFFLRHLMDADAASNTLSWRWVGGLHTKGKTYLARPDNIARYTANQPSGPLSADGLAHEAPALEEAADHQKQALDLPQSDAADLHGADYALILHDEGACHMAMNLPHPPKLVLGMTRPEARSPLPVGETARNFARSAVETGVDQAGDAFGCKAKLLGEGEGLQQSLGQAGLQTVAFSYLPTGWTRDALLPELMGLPDAVNIVPLLSEVEHATWPYAKAGFFGVKKKIESILGEVGIDGSSLDAAE
ncbi:FAD-binding domain-containing protein [Erythrobacter sp. MTPC3]|uniref:FAD-binding domain-containing protein n=1 Tax=Erythrobacter sp. MTPC3 TaxID=3056564 RepID=UPI0036F278E3